MLFRQTRVPHLEWRTRVFILPGHVSICPVSISPCIQTFVPQGVLTVDLSHQLLVVRIRTRMRCAVFPPTMQQIGGKAVLRSSLVRQDYTRDERTSLIRSVYSWHNGSLFNHSCKHFRNRPYSDCSRFVLIWSSIRGIPLAV